MTGPAAQRGGTWQGGRLPHASCTRVLLGPYPGRPSRPRWPAGAASTQARQLQAPAGAPPLTAQAQVAGPGFQHKLGLKPAWGGPLLRHRARQPVSGQVQLRQLGQRVARTPGVWQAACQLVAAEVQVLQAGARPALRQAAVEPIGAQVDFLRGQRWQLRRQRPTCRARTGERARVQWHAGRQPVPPGRVRAACRRQQSRYSLPPQRTQLVGVEQR